MGRTSEIFKCATGKTPWEFKYPEPILKAIELLQEYDLPFKELCFIVSLIIAGMREEYGD